MDSDNSRKSKRGQKREKALKNRLVELQKAKKIKSFKSKSRFTREGSLQGQFYAPFEIEFDDGSKWAVFSSTSYKSDREKGNQWDAFNIKQIDENVEHCFLVITTDDKKKLAEILEENDKLLEKYSALDYIVKDSDFFDLLEEKSYKTRERTRGQIHDEKGRSFEDRIAFVLQEASNLRKWQGDSLESGVDYEFLFLPIMEALDIDRYKIASVEATTVIPQLPSGGSPKTDVAVKILYLDGREVVKTISCKSSSKNGVSVHQYPAETFIRTLQIDDEKLKNCLIHFQECGGWVALKEKYGEDELVYLGENLPAYNRVLSMWVFGGYGGETSDPNLQLAQYLLVRSEISNTISISPIADHVSKIIEEGCRPPLNTPFQWTYASGSKGKSIQLKAKIG